MLFSSFFCCGFAFIIIQSIFLTAYPKLYFPDTLRRSLDSWIVSFLFFTVKQILIENSHFVSVFCRTFCGESHIFSRNFLHNTQNDKPILGVYFLNSHFIFPPAYKTASILHKLPLIFFYLSVISYSFPVSCVMLQYHLIYKYSHFLREFRLRFLL